MYVNQASISPLKHNEEAIHVVNVALAQLLLLANSPPDIENYVCKENEVKLLCPLYDIETACFLGLEKRLATISVRGDDDKLFLSYGYVKEKCKQLFSLHKVRLPNIFQSTSFQKHKDYLKGDDKGKSSTLFVICLQPLTEKNQLINTKEMYNYIQLIVPMKNFLNFQARKVIFFRIILSQLIQRNVKLLEKLSLIL